ncbi:MAG: hypothetical protein JWL75_540 [Parcubacteria group bacterium]|nr:hypothetical protein [Parcubacteria group bacterium]
MAIGGAIINFGSFWVFYHVLQIWYLLAAVSAFALRFFFKFLIIRTWLFLDPHMSGTFLIHGTYFFVLELSSLAVSTLLLFILVQGLELPPFLALIGIVALMSAGNAMLTRLFFRPRVSA